MFLLYIIDTSVLTRINRGSVLHMPNTDLSTITDPLFKVKY